MESSSSNFNKNNTENANEITKNSILSSQTSKKKVLFQFPPLPNNKHEANTHSSHRKLKIDPKNMSDDTTEELKIEKLTRKQKKNESQNNLSLISAVLSQNTFISVNNFEFSKSLQENKIIDENPFEEFEDEDQKMINSSILEKLNSKFVLKNTQFTGNLDCPLKIEDEAPISLTYDERKRISICYVDESILCLGYDNGVILVYKHIDRNFCMVLPPPSTSSENITSFDVLEDGTKLVAGYFKGSICIFDLGNGKLVKKIENLLNSPIIFIKIINKTELYKGKLSLILGTWNDKIYRLKWYEKKILGLNTTKIKPIETLNYYFNIKQLLNIVPFVYKNTDGVSFKFLAVATFDKILVIDLKNLKQCPFEFKRPEFVEKQSLPYLFWEELDFKGSETLGNLLISLLFIWGNYICATGVFEKEKQFSFKMIKYLLINWNFSFASVFSPNLIFGITDDKEKGGFIVHFNDLHDGDVTPKILNEITKFPIKIELNFQKNIFWNSYHDSLCLSSVLKKKNLLFFVEDKNLLKTIHVLNWEHPVKILHKSQNFINAMKLIIDLYKGSVRNYSDISNNQIIKRKSLKRLIEEITQEYIKKYYDTFWSSEAIEKAKFMNNSSNRDESFMLMVIEFLVETEQYEYLFQKIYQDFEKMHRQTQFLECLEPFIFAQKIKYIPDKSLVKLINFYLEQKKIYLVQPLILSLDLTWDRALMENFDFSEIIQICLENHFYNALIYLCTESDNNFMIPLIQIFSYYLFRKGKPDQDLGEIQKIGYRALWYIDKCLKGLLINGKKIPALMMDSVIVDLTNWIFEETNLKNMILLDAKLVFSFLIRFFDENGKLYLIILRNQYKIFHTSKKEKNINDCRWIFGALVENVIQSENKLMQEDENGQFYKEKISYFYEFIVSIFEMELCEINKKVCLDCFFYINENPIILESLKRNKGSDKENEIEIKNSQFLFDLLKYSTNDTYDFEDSRFRKILTVTPFTQIKISFNKAIKNYKRCFDLYLETKNDIIKAEIFKWYNEIIRKAISSVPKANYYEEIKDLFILNISSLLLVNSEKTHDIINNFFQESDIDIVKNLSNKTHLKTEYIEKRLKVRKSNELKLLYLENLSKEKEIKKIIKFLENEECPLKESLEICEKYQIKKAIVILLPRTGKIEESLNLHLEILKEKIKKWHSEFLIKYVSNEKIASFIDERINSIKLMLNLHKKSDEFQTQELSVKFIESLILIYEESQSLTRSEFINLQFLKDYFERKLIEVFDYIIVRIPFLNLVEKLFDKTAKIKIAYIKYGFIQMFSNAFFKKKILRIEKNHLIQITANYRMISFLNNHKGYFSDQRCSLCQLLFEEKEQIMIFKCGHIIHKKCIQLKDECIICLENKSEKILSVILNFVRQKQKLVSNTLDDNKNSESNFFKGIEIIPEEEELNYLKIENKRFLKRKRKIQILENFDRKNAIQKN